MNESERKMQEHFAKRIPGEAFSVVNAVAKKASADPIFNSALSIFNNIKWHEIDAIANESKLLDESFPESEKESIHERLRVAKAKFAQLSAARDSMMDLLHPKAGEYYKVIESSFSNAYEIGSSQLHEIPNRVDLMRDIVAGFNMYSHPMFK